MQPSRARAARASIATAVVLLTFALGVPAALAGPTVTVRIEGTSSTLLPATTVTLGTAEPLKGCAAGSAAAAIDIATGGNWDRKAFTETILGETHSFTHSDTWAEWINNKWGGGICNDILHEGDEVLMVADVQAPPTYAASVLPLVVGEVPAVVQSGSAFAVKVSVAHLPPGEVPPGSGTLEAAEGVTVSAGETSATSGANGVATLTLGSVGTVTLRASRAGDAPSRTFTICVHNGNDGNCGTPRAPASGGVQPLTATPERRPQSPQALPYVGPFALVAAIAGLPDGRTYRVGHGPQLIAGQISAHASVNDVSLRLHRSLGRRCWNYDGARERFTRAGCGEPPAFLKVSAGASFFYLLAAQLPRGRYVLDLQASDAAGNHLTPARGTSRLVFYVR